MDFELRKVSDDYPPAVDVVSVSKVDGALHIGVKGYGDYHSPDGEGHVIVLERLNSVLCAVVWANINNDEPSQIIPLEGAREDLRRPPIRRYRR